MLLAVTVMECPVRAEEYTASQVFSKFQAVYAKTKTVAALFDETTIMDGQRRTATGRLIFSKPNLLRQEYYDPKDPKTVAQVIVLDGKMSWSFTPWLNQVTRKAIDARSSRELFPGAGENFEKIATNFVLKLKKDDAARKKGAYLLVIEPKPNATGKVGNEYLEAWIRSSDWLPMQFSYTNKASDVVTIVSLRDMKLDVTPPKNAFVFDVPPGVEVVTIKDDYKNDK
jgi:outer membrane lipoprotein-sorting protein